LGIPSIWHIHESVSISDYSSTFLFSAVGELISNAFQTANRIVFQANATRKIFSEFESVGNLLTIPGGIPLERIEDFRNSNTKASLRMKHGIPEDAYVVVLVGTTCERKGQSVFLDAINLIDFTEPPENFIFLIVGAIEGPYLNMLRGKIAKLGLNKVQLVNETKEIYDYYALSDLFVCASYEESFPMVILLAMAFELPIVSTDVFGIPEIISNIQDGLLVGPGNPQTLAKAIMNAIQNKDETKAMATRAFAKVYRLFNGAKLNARNANLARKVLTEEVRTKT
jgi:glycosyltransferase involved in cell wall biosynthesis